MKLLKLIFNWLFFILVVGLYMIFFVIVIGVVIFIENDFGMSVV